MLYRKKIYKGIIKKLLGFLLIILFGLFAIYAYLYYAVDFKRASYNLSLVSKEFEFIDKSFKDFLRENEEAIDKALADEKINQTIVNKYYSLYNKLGIDYQIDFYPNNNSNFAFAKKKVDYSRFKSYQDIIGLKTDGLSTNSFKDGQDIIYVVRSSYKNGRAILYIPAKNISRKLKEKASDFYINDAYGKVVFNESSLVENSLNKLSKLGPNFLDKGKYIEETVSYDEFEIHALVERTISNNQFFFMFIMILSAGAFIIMVFLASLRQFIEEATDVISKLNTQIYAVAEGKMDRINIRTDDEFNTIVKNINNLIDSKKILLDKNVRLKYINKYNEFKMLESQFNPHFLYNTLELISITMYIDPKVSDRLIQDLNEILRYSINDLSFIRFDEDISYIYKFLDIEKIKSEENFTYIIDMDNASGDVLVPKLFLQPLIENSLKYGRKYTTKLGIRVNIKLQDKILSIRVKDNGKPLTDKELKDLNYYIELESQKDYISMKHHGLVNTYNRLKMLYKKQVKMQFVPCKDGVLIEIRIRI